MAEAHAEAKGLFDQLTIRENQLESIQNRLSEVEQENEMMSDRDDQIIQLRDQLKARVTKLAKSLLIGKS